MAGGPADEERTERPIVAGHPVRDHPASGSLIAKEFAPGGALGGRDADFVGAIIVSALLGLTILNAARSWLTIGVLANAQVASLAGTPIYILSVVGFVTRERATVPPGTGEFLVPFTSAVSPAIALNLAQFAAPQWGTPLGYVVAVVGVVLSVAALISLRKSFAVLPAVRRVVTTGPYRLLRHPLYLGESLYVVGFIILAASWANLVALSFVAGLLAWRVLIEERKLLGSAEYPEYCRRVRFRLLPGIW